MPKKTNMLEDLTEIGGYVRPSLLVQGKGPGPCISQELARAARSARSWPEQPGAARSSQIMTRSSQIRGMPEAARLEAARQPGGAANG